jgi:hypothetical protein
MRLDDREALRRRFAFRCGYCDVSEEDVGAELTVLHCWWLIAWRAGVSSN